MKFSTIMMVTTIALAFVSTGCKYDKVNGEGDEGGLNALTDEGNLSDITGQRRFEDMYTKCTDVSFNPVYFGFDSTVIPTAEISKIDAVVQHLKDHSDRVVVVEGNCDERGSTEYNVSLGQRRAIIIQNYLVQCEISSDRIQTRSYGEEQPAVDGHDEAAWAKNRRGEFVIFQK